VAVLGGGRATRRAGPVVAALALLVLAGPAEARAVRAGDIVPEMTLADLEGGAVALASLRGKVVIVDFWATWCAPCATALPALDAIARRHAGRDLAVLAVSIDRDRARAARYLAERLPATAMTVLHDPRGGALARFGAATMPALYVVDRGGIVRLVTAGYEAGEIEPVGRTVEELLGAAAPGR
jgi:thiol-disulfide isomerase/thioredoxin